MPISFAAGRRGEVNIYVSSLRPVRGTRPPHARVPRYSPNAGVSPFLLTPAGNAERTGSGAYVMCVMYVSSSDPLGRRAIGRRTRRDTNVHVRAVQTPCRRCYYSTRARVYFTVTRTDAVRTIYRMTARDAPWFLPRGDPDVDARSRRTWRNNDVFFGTSIVNIGPFARRVYIRKKACERTDG